MERSLAIRQQVLGSEHPDVAIALNNLADILMSQVITKCETIVNLETQKRARSFDAGIPIKHFWFNVAGAAAHRALCTCSLVYHTFFLREYATNARKMQTCFFC